MAVNYSSLPFLEQLAFFRAKLNLPTARWDDLLGAAHDRAFVVAGAMQADLLADLKAAVDKAMTDGATLAQFRKDFDQIVAQRGWTGWTGQGTKAGEAWRTRVIYETNLFSSYSAGRVQQMKAVANTRPYWRYRHSPASVEARAEHLAWDGMILRHDDPFWAAHTPPNGFGCKCYIETLADRDLKKQGREVTPSNRIPYNGTNPKTGLPEGVDKGWDYQPGANAGKELADLVTRKKAGWPNELAKAFDQWMKGKSAPLSGWKNAMDDPEWLGHLEGYKTGAGWLEEGGRVILDENGQFLMRSKWLAKEQWWADYVSMNSTGRVVAWKVKAIIEKAMAGKKLGKAEDRFLSWLHEYTQEQKALQQELTGIIDPLIEQNKVLLKGIKARFIEQVGDAGNEMLSAMMEDFYGSNPYATIAEANQFMIAELKDWMGEK